MNNNKKIKLKWVLAHIPYDLFLRSAAAFAKKAHEISNGAIEIEIMGLDQYEQKYNHGKKIDKYAVLNMVDNGTIEMSQMYNAQLGAINHDLRSMDLPYLFDTHEQAKRVLDGDIGVGMLAALANRSNVRGLAFTYSGGFRIMVGNQPIKSADDMAGQRCRVSLSPVAADSFKLLNCEPVAMGVHAVADALKNNLVDIGENTWARFFRSGVNQHATHIANTKHSLFLTAMIINKQVWNSFSPEVQEMLQTAALAAAEVERQENIVDGEKTMEEAKQAGITVLDWNKDQCDHMKELTRPVYAQYKNHFTPGLLDRILNS